MVDDAVERGSPPGSLRYFAVLFSGADRRASLDAMYAFETELRRTFGDRVTRNGHAELRLPNTANVNFVGRVGAEVLGALGDVAASTGSACHAGSVELSPVLRAMGVAPEEGMGAVRFSLGRPTTREEIDEVLRRIKVAVR